MPASLTVEQNFSKISFLPSGVFKEENLSSFHAHPYSYTLLVKLIRHSLLGFCVFEDLRASRRTLKAWLGLRVEPPDLLSHIETE